MRRALILAAFAGAIPLTMACGKLLGIHAVTVDAGDQVSDAFTMDASEQDSPDLPDSPGQQEAGDACGPRSVRISDGLANFCIDTTEVTHAEYEAFTQSSATGALLAQLPSFCPPMTVFGEPPAADPPDFPARDISWCDAWGFCRWAGKRLCGRIGGGSTLTQTETASATYDEAYFACSRGGRQAEPYGTTEVPGACDVGPDASPGPVASWAGCVGGYPGLRDMVGSVEEFYDAVQFNDAGAVTYFGYRGGSWMMASADCTHHSGIDVGTAKATIVGIRCCADAPP